MIFPETFISRWKNDPLIEADPEYAFVWGSTELAAYDPAIVQQLLISEEAKRFLVSAGLPRQAFTIMHFDIPTSRLRPVQDTFQNVSIPFSSSRYRLLGVEAEASAYGAGFFAAICLDNQEQGKVVRITDNGSTEIAFMNSSVMQLAEFLLVFRENLAWMKKNINLAEPPKDLSEYSRSVINTLETIDLPATLEGGVWDYTIHEIRDME